jgi:transposase
MGAAHRDTDVVSAEDRELAQETERLRRKIRSLNEERDIPKEATTPFFASQKP